MKNSRNPSRESGMRWHCAARARDYNGPIADAAHPVMNRSTPAFPPAALLLALAAAPAAAVENGFYAGIAADWSIVDVDFSKTVSLEASAPGVSDAPARFRDPSGAFSRTSRPSGDDGNIIGLRALAGYRWRLSERFYFAGELEAVKYDSEEITGRVSETNDAGHSDFEIWDGVWKFEKDRSFGINTKLGYAPGGGVLGDGSIYALFGVRWLDGDVSANYTSPNGSITGGHRDGYSETPWRVGVGMEIGDADSWFDLQLSYADYDIDFTRRPGTARDDPRLGHEYEVEEWGLSLGYTRRFGD